MTGAVGARHSVVVAIALVLASCAPPAPPSRTPLRSTTTIPASASSSPTTTLTAGPGSRGLAATDRLERQHQLAQALPHSTPHYRIDLTVGADGRLRLVVTLLAELNSPDDLAGYQAQLRRYKAEALEFIRAQGDDPATYTVTFLPPDPTNPKEST